MRTIGQIIDEVIDASNKVQIEVESIYFDKVAPRITWRLGNAFMSTSIDATRLDSARFDYVDQIVAHARYMLMDLYRQKREGKQ